MSSTRKNQALNLFQFTPLREGRRFAFQNIGTIPFIFQFTPLREGRQMRSAETARRKYFNSRPSARGDKASINSRLSDLISIHAPPRGAT